MPKQGAVCPPHARRGAAGGEGEGGGTTRGAGGSRFLHTAAVGCLLAALACGCGTVANARFVENRGDVVPGERTPTAAELGLPVSGEVALGDVVRAALAAHPSVVGARRAAEAAAARVREAEAAFLPHVGTSASATRHEQKSVGPGTGERRFVRGGFDVSWLLFDFGRSKALARQAGEAWIAAQADLRSAEVSVAFEARRAYFELAKGVQSVVAAGETVRQFESHLESVTELERVGKRIPYDVTKAKVDLGNARLAEVVARDAVLAAEATLASAVGLAEILDWKPAADAAPPAPPATFDEAWKAAQTGQPTLAAAEARERAASALVEARIAGLYPSASLDFGATWSGSKTPLPWSLDLGPSVAWTPFDGFENVATIDEAVADLRGERTSLAAAAQRAWLDTRTAWLALADARQRVGLATETLASAVENRALAQGRFDARVATSVELADAEQALAEAKAAKIQAVADAAIAAAALAKAMGVAGPDEGGAPGAGRQP